MCAISGVAVEWHRVSEKEASSTVENDEEKLFAIVERVVHTEESQYLQRHSELSR